MKPSPQERAAFESFARSALGKPKKSKSIHIKKSHEGMLHEDLGVPQGKPIPAAKLAQAKQSSDPAERKRAQFAANVKRWGK